MGGLGRRRESEPQLPRGQEVKTSRSTSSSALLSNNKFFQQASCYLVRDNTMDDKLRHITNPQYSQQNNLRAHKIPSHFYNRFKIREGMVVFHVFLWFS